jgi:hypothetical protein
LVNKQHDTIRALAHFCNHEPRWLMTGSASTSIERMGQRGVMALTALRPAAKPHAAMPKHGNLAL